MHRSRLGAAAGALALALGYRALRDRREQAVGIVRFHRRPALIAPGANLEAVLVGGWRG
jgi:hypothetical protein